MPEAVYRMVTLLSTVLAQRPAFAIGVPPDICAFHRYTRNSNLPYRTLVCPYPLQAGG